MVIGLLLVFWIATAAIRDSVPLSVEVAEAQVSVMDVLALTLAGAGVVRIFSQGVSSLARGLVVFLLALFVLHLLRGAMEFGTQTAVNNGRDALYYVATLIFVASVRWDSRIWKVLIVAGGLLTAIAVPLWLTGGLGSSQDVIFHNGELITTRPIVSVGALLILQAIILALALRWPSKRLAFWGALGSVAVLVLLQHRTLWVVGFFVAIASFIWWSTGVRQASARSAFAAIGALLLVLPIAIAGFVSTGPLVESAREATSENSTLKWRATGWAELIESHHSTSQIAFGQPSGASLDRRINGQTVDVSAHNGFVETYLQYGVPGLVAFIFLLLILWIRRKVVAEGTGLTTQAVGLLLLTQLLFSASYSLDAVQGVVTGALVAGLAAAAPAQASARSPSAPLRNWTEARA